jgi:hypothetical protein
MTDRLFDPPRQIAKLPAANLRPVKSDLGSPGHVSARVTEFV